MSEFCCFDKLSTNNSSSAKTKQIVSKTYQAKLFVKVLPVDIALPTIVTKARTTFVRKSMIVLTANLSFKTEDRTFVTRKIHM